MAQNEVQYVKMPLLALRGLHVFPGMLLTFDVERTASIGALNNAVRADQLIFLTAQKERFRAAVAVVHGLGADHFRDGTVRTESGADLAEGPVRDPGHGRKEDRLRDRQVSEPHYASSPIITAR